MIAQFDRNRHEGLWRDYLSRTEDASPYHTREWAAVVRDTFHFQECSLVLENAESLMGILPLWRVNSRTLVNAPWRDRANLLCPDSERRTVFPYLERLTGNVIIRGWEYGDIPRGYRLENYWFLSILDLTEDKDLFEKRINKSLGRNIRKAINAGVHIMTEKTLENLDHFYKLFKATRKRLGVPIYSIRLFKNMFHHLQKDSWHLYLAARDERPIAAAIFLDGGIRTIYAYGASDMNYQEFRANDLMLWTAIRDSISRGKKIFDFGSDSPEQVTLLRFKRKWGCQQHPLPTLVKMQNYVPPEKRDFSSRHYVRHRRLLSRLPAWGLVWIGSFMSRCCA